MYRALSLSSVPFPICRIFNAYTLYSVWTGQVYSVQSLCLSLFLAFPFYPYLSPSLSISFNCFLCTTAHEATRLLCVSGYFLPLFAFPFSVPFPALRFSVPMRRHCVGKRSVFFATTILLLLYLIFGFNYVLIQENVCFLQLEQALVTTTVTYPN